MKKKILGVLLAVGIIAGVIAGCGNSNTTQNGAENANQASATAKARTLDEIKKSGKIKIGVFSDKNPFGYVDENGKVQGYDVYFAKRIAKDLLGSEDAVDFVYVEAASRVEYLKSAKVDITLANFTVTDERKEHTLRWRSSSALNCTSSVIGTICSKVFLPISVFCTTASSRFRLSFFWFSIQKIPLLALVCAKRGILYTGFILHAFDRRRRSVPPAGVHRTARTAPASSLQRHSPARLRRSSG